MASELPDVTPVAKGWSLFMLPQTVRSFFRAPPTWFSAPIVVLGGFFTLWLAWQLIWLLITFMWAIGTLSNFATTGTKPETADALKHVIGATGGVLGGLIATGLVVWRTWLSQRQTKTAEDQRKLTEQNQYTAQFSKAIEQLGSMIEDKTKEISTDSDGKQTIQESIKMIPNLPLRLGAIYSLQRISQDSFRDHWPIIETLCAYVRQQSKTYISNKPRVDIQAAISAIANRRNEWKSLETPDQILNFEGAILRGVDMRGLDMRRSNFRETDFSDADIEYCDFQNSRFFKSIFSGSILTGSIFNRSTFEFSNFELSHLNYCQFNNSKIIKTNFTSALLVKTDFTESKIENSDFGKCDLCATNGLTQDNIESMGFSLPKSIPAGLKPKKEWLDQLILLEEFEQNQKNSEKKWIGLWESSPTLTS